MKVLGRAGKASGTLANWVNVSDGTRSYSLDRASVTDWKEASLPEDDLMSSVEYGETLVCLGSDMTEVEFEDAKAAELLKWQQFDVYDEVVDNGQCHLTGRWVCTKKYGPDGSENKARFVAKGFQESIEIPSDSPTGSKECLRLMLLLVSSQEWVLHCLDVKSAFLQGKYLDRIVYLKPPFEAGTSGVLWKLKKCVYGLSDASRKWYLALSEKLQSLGCQRSKFDYGMFHMRVANNLIGLLVMHVDDILWSGTAKFAELVISPLCASFNIGKHAEKEFQYVGVHIAQDDSAIYVDQIEYLNEISAIDIAVKRRDQKSMPCSSEEATSFRRLVGMLNWVASQTRPDLSFDVCRLSSCMGHPTVGDLFKANKVLGKIKQSPLKITFPKLENFVDSKVIVHADASLANLPNGKSVGGYVVFLGDTANMCGPIVWKSNTLKRVVRSTLAAETCAALEGLDAAFFISKIASEMIGSSLPIVAFTDNRPLYKNVHSTTMAHEYRLRIDLAAIKEMLIKQEVMSFSWVEKSKQLADCLTKFGASPLLLLSVLETGIMSV